MKPERLLITLAALPAACGTVADRTRDCATAIQGDPGGWRCDFGGVAPDLRPTGVAPYADLRPGAVRIYRDGETVLTIRVLDELMVVDGVRARVVEEREDVDGVPVEISRNYFAIDRNTRDVYYLGEDVDVFRNGALSGHPGAWRSGEQGARFGLAIPAAPRVGDRYYQELAPGVAMDRAEIVSVDETVVTPAGSFPHCVHVRETTPLEADVSHKWYAHEIGLVKDDELVLVSLTRPPPG